MTTEEKLFRDRLEKSLGRFCPNITALNQISTYLFREVVKIIKNSENPGEILQNTETNSDIEALSFMRAIKDLSVFSSQVIIDEAFKKAFQDVKNTIPLVERESVIERNREVTKINHRNNHTSSSLSKNEAEFDIDLSSIPKVNTYIKQEVQPKSDVDSNVFKGDFDFDLDDINQRTVKHVVSNEKENDGEDKDFTTDGSAFSEDIYSDSFSVDVSLDY